MKPPKPPTFSYRTRGVMLVICLPDSMRDRAREVICKSREKHGLGNNRPWFEVVRAIESKVTVAISSVTGELVSEERQRSMPGRSPGRPKGQGAQRVDSVRFNVCYAIVSELRAAGVPALRGSGPGRKLAQDFLDVIFPSPERPQELASALARAISCR